MLSVLIPTYHYNSLPLVKEIHKQCEKANVVFEIIVQDDASESDWNIENEKINALPHCLFTRNSINLGRGRNINTMAEKAQYAWLLILDCDTLPTQENFLSNYVTEITRRKEKVVYGGIVYKPERPGKDELLRWIYGNQREAIPYTERLKNPYWTTLSSNLLIAKDIFTSILFDAAITKYGYEDTVFVKNLKLQSVPIHHIHNPLFHLNLETSAAFMKKVRESLDNLKRIADLKLLTADDNRILRTYRRISSFGLQYLLALLFTLFNKKAEKMLLSANPSLLLLDLYKLGYFCKIKS